MRKETSKKKNAKDAALNYLSYRARTVTEIKNYLKKKDFPPQEIRETVDLLIECNILSDEKYCEEYIRYCLEKGKGPYRIERDLREKGIDPAIYSGELETAFGGGKEKELAQELTDKLLPSGTAYGPKELARVARALESRGFHSGVIWDVLGRLQKDQ